MKNFAILNIILLIFSFQPSTSTLYQSNHVNRRLEEMLAVLKTQFSSRLEHSGSPRDGKPKSYLRSHPSNNIRTKIDPNDHIDVELWNKLNEEDIKNMPVVDDYSDESLAFKWLQWYIPIIKRYNQIDAHLGWNYETNITTTNQEALTAQSLIRAPFVTLYLPVAKRFNEYMKYSNNQDLKRIFSRLALDMMVNNSEDTAKESELSAKLSDIYSTTKVCEPDDPGKCYTLSPYLEQVMQGEKDYDRLLWAWKGWHDECGNKIRPVYLPYVDLITRKAKENAFKDLSEVWIQEYEMGDSNEFESIIDKLLQDIMPLYKELHAYVRGRLCSMYPGRFDCRGPIPAHLLGNMWAQTWNERFNDLIPFPDAPLVNITKALIEKDYTVDDMFKTAESFFTSIGLYPMTPKFWARSLLEKPDDRDVVCHASAHDMLYHEDFRIKMCTRIDENDFYVVHHEMGHIEYFMAYTESQPYLYRSGANSGFHEAIGDTIGMFAVSPTHLVKLGFLKDNVVNSHYEINLLLHLALQKVAFLPFSYVMDKYRFKLFRNQIDREHELNSMWWALRMEHGGIMAPSPRNDKDNFDAGAKFHIPANVPYLRYFIAHILQFQFYRGMCELQGVTEKLYTCDIYGNKKVGERFKEMMAMGNSMAWSEILEILTGENQLDSGAMIDFFQPLYEWLKEENRVKGYPVGWN